MKVFISWSGQRSRVVAELLADWIRCVLQATRPWISTRDIDRGALWFTEIGDQLHDTAVGIICLTNENKDRPWILFEAGALAKGLSSNRVCTFLIDIKPTDIEDPLAQFNHTVPERESVWGLVRTLNSYLGSDGLDERILERVFDTYWPQFEEDFEQLLDENPPVKKVEPRSEESVLNEVLENTRALNSRLRVLERNVRSESQNDDEVIASRMDLVSVIKRAARMTKAGASRSEIREKLLETGLPSRMADLVMSKVDELRKEGEQEKSG